MLQLPRILTHQARLHKREEGAICYNTWCSLHTSTTHSDAECNAQKRKHNTENQPQGEVQSAHIATESTATEDVGYTFVTAGWTLSTDCQATAQTTKSMEATADTPRLAPKPLTMLVENRASGDYFEDELHSDPKDTQLNCMALERPHKILTAGRQVLPGTATGMISENHRHGRQQASGRTCRLGRTWET